MAKPLRTASATATVVVSLFLTAKAASASAILVHDYELNGNLGDALGGPSLVAYGGTLGASGYTFGANQGLSLSSGINASDYSIVLDFSIANTSGYRKLIDFKSRASDNGLYNLNTALDFYPQPAGPALALQANTVRRVTLTRDGSTNTTNGYVNGVVQFTFVDGSAVSTFSDPGNIVNFFMDDFATSQREASAGFADAIRIYDGALTAGEVAPPLASVPEPMSLVLLGSGIVALARRGARCKSALRNYS